MAESRKGSNLQPACSAHIASTARSVLPRLLQICSSVFNLGSIELTAQKTHSLDAFGCFYERNKQLSQPTPVVPVVPVPGADESLPGRREG